MDFAWVVDALRRGLKVTRKVWAGGPPIYLYVIKGENGKKAIMMCPGTGSDFEWYPRPDHILDITDWEEYVEPKKDIQMRSVPGETTKTTPGEMPLWPGVTHQEGPFVSNPLPFTTTMEMRGGQAVKEPDLDAEANKAIALVARNIAENLVELLQNPSVLRLL